MALKLSLIKDMMMNLGFFPGESFKVLVSSNIRRMKYRMQKCLKSDWLASVAARKLDHDRRLRISHRQTQLSLAE
jgi:hypothetical protein